MWILNGELGKAMGAVCHSCHYLPDDKRGVIRNWKVHSVASEWQREVWLMSGDTLEIIWWTVAEGEEDQNPGRQWRKVPIPVLLGHMVLMEMRGKQMTSGA